MPLMASHTVLVMTSAEKLGPGRSRTPPLPSLAARVYRRRAARGEPGRRRCLPLCEALPYTPCARTGPDPVSRCALSDDRGGHHERRHHHLPCGLGAARGGAVGQHRRRHGQHPVRTVDGDVVARDDRLDRRSGHTGTQGRAPFVRKEYRGAPRTVANSGGARAPRAQRDGGILALPATEGAACANDPGPASRPKSSPAPCGTPSKASPAWRTSTATLCRPWANASTCTSTCV